MKTALILVGIGTVVVAALLLMPQLFAGFSGSVVVPDGNSRTNPTNQPTGSLPADGWVDITVTVSSAIYSLTDTKPTLLPTGKFVVAKETVGSTTAPVTTIIPRPATINTACIGQYEMDVTGADIGTIHAKTAEIPFDAASATNVEFKFGHIWLYKGSSYTITVTAFASKCLSLMDHQQLRSDAFTIKFDGQSQGIDGGGKRFCFDASGVLVYNGCNVQ